MRISAFGRAAAMAFVYIAVFVVLVMVQFPSGGPITEVSGGVSFKGLPDGDGVRSAELVANGLRLVFSERYPLLLSGGAGPDGALYPVAYEAVDDGFIVRFDDGTRLFVNADDEGRASWRLDAKRSKKASATMRYELAYGAALLAPGDDGSIRLSFGDATYRVSGVTTGSEPRTLSLKATGGAFRAFASIRETKDAAETPAQFLAQAPMDPALWSREIGAWRDKAWSSVSGADFDAASGTWSGAFDEPSFVLYLAEAMRRDLRDAAAALVAVARSSHADSLSWKSAPFAGKTATSMAAFEAANLAEVKATERLVQARAGTMFYRRGIVPLLFDRAPYSLAQEAMSLARSTDFSKADATQAAALLEAYLDAAGYLDEADNPFSRAVELVDRTIAPAIKKAEGGFFLQTDGDGRCDLLTGLYAGKALIRLSESSGKAIYAGIGQSLVTSAVKLAAADGSIPASVTATGGMLTKSPERLSAAMIYPVVA
ncbi:MAG TPA: hypothetical protein PLW80_05455, partial [Spirochaetales bacterium]|nr:hypothetical protein [Spirochaetales bacterium]